MDREESNRNQVKASERARYAADPEKFKARVARFRQSDEGRRVRSAWYAANPTYQRDWYAKNAEEQRKKQRLRREAKPDVYRAHGRNRRARARNAEGFHTAEDVERIRKLQNARCAYCNLPVKGDDHVDHIMPLVRGGSNWPANLQILCTSCNTSKNAADPVDFARSLGRLL